MYEQIQEFRRYVDLVGGAHQAAERLGLKPRMVYAMLSGHRNISVRTANRAHTDSGGAVSKSVLIFGENAQ